MKSLFTFMAAVCLFYAPWAKAAEPVGGPLDIGSHRELFVDLYLIDKMAGTNLQLHRPVDRGPVLKFDGPFEGPFCAYVTVIHAADNKYQMYYRGSAGGSDKSDQQVTCYAESTDGITWVKPMLDLFPRGDLKRTNIVLANAAPVTHNFCPFIDARPNVLAEERYKAIGGYNESGLMAYASPDGVHWHNLGDTPVLTREQLGSGFFFDSQNVPFWSEHESKYLLYYRVYKDKKRRIARVESGDFQHWSNPMLMEYERNAQPAPIEELYTNQTHPYFRAPQIYISTAARFMINRQVLTTQQAEAIHVDPKYFHDTSDAVFMTSRGGNVYDRRFMTAFVAPGIGAENWVSRTNYPALNVVQTGPSEMSLYVNQNYGQPTSHLRRYTLRLDGFASVHADYDGGEMITHPLKFEGSHLLLNFATSAPGGIRVEAQNADGMPYPGFALGDCRELIGNEIEREVTWQNSKIGSLAGKVIRLRFVMKDADLFALRFSKDSEALHVLEQTSKTPGWVGVHGAEALIALGRSDMALAAFASQAASTEPRLRIGAWRILAKAENDPARRQAYVVKIRAVLLDENAVDRLHALEALAKLGEPFISAEERNVVQTMGKDPANAPFALWRLQQNGDTSAINELIKCLKGSDVAGRSRAAHVLSRFPDSGRSVQLALADALASEQEGSPAYAWLSAAVGGPAARALIDDPSPATRYVGAMWLAEHGIPQDQPMAKRLASDPDPDVRGAAAFASLMIDRRSMPTTPAIK